jgi:hypothetical protein
MQVNVYLLFSLRVFSIEIPRIYTVHFLQIFPLDFSGVLRSIYILLQAFISQDL